MEFTTEQITETGLSEDQVTKVQELTNTHEADLKKGWDGTANTNAEKIIQGAADRVEAITGIKREDGQKIADYLTTSSENFFKGKESALAQKEIDLDKKIKEGGSDEKIKAELEKTQGLLDGFKQKAATFDEWETADYKNKYEAVTKDLSGLKLQVAYQKVKPSFPETVNKYEANAKWNEFVSGVNEKHTIELDENNEPWAVDKENEHKKVKLQSIVEKDKTISELSKGRSATGLGSGKTNLKLEGLPFSIPENATKKELEKAVKEHITGTEGLKFLDKKYPARFAELYKKATEKNPAKV